MSVRSLAQHAIVLALVAAPLAAQAPTPLPLAANDSTNIMKRGHTYMHWVLAGHADSLIGGLTKEFVDASGGAEAMADRVRMLSEHAGTVTGTPIEKMTRRNGNPQFWFEASFTDFTDEPIVIRFVFDAGGNVSGIGMGPKSQAKWDQ